MRLLTLLMLLVAAASPPADAHDWYTGLRSPTGVDCCGGRDCRPVPYRLSVETGREEIQANGAWWPVEYDKVPLRGRSRTWDGSARPDLNQRSRRL